ncbi:hypothetical protein [Pseudooceanicola marinus]|uniref:hypothetical protein n=1 Tax=Pseudooceanicola marinus TaxID=396013 RepID=UPI001CD7B1B8|nr:hypothetical protein [Pseudooceanicola marinus]MCA1337367.1 hypothetical protein [Pseudooceanicola marinus]
MTYTASILATVAALSLAGCNASTFSKIEESKPVPLSAAQISQIEDTVTRDFFDPATAQFRDLRAVTVHLADGTTETRVCGEVNGKNRMGGYVGFQGFGGQLINGRFQQEPFFAPCEQW